MQTRNIVLVLDLNKYIILNNNIIIGLKYWIIENNCSIHSPFKMSFSSTLKINLFYRLAVVHEEVFAYGVDVVAIRVA